jgi:hypothetical protein
MKIILDILVSRRNVAISNEQTKTEIKNFAYVEVGAVHCCSVKWSCVVGGFRMYQESILNVLSKMWTNSQPLAAQRGD